MRRLLFLLLVPFVLFTAGTGCSSKPKPSGTLASDMEEKFKQRWIAKRMSDLQAAGQAADARDARRMAAEEFKQRFAYTTIAQKPDPVSGSVVP
ncbi:MAG: hypothetical protein LBC18_08455 [Opitutaceae bacterium]|nr:hypothetical protein [Opitutaceae bacterium]